LGVKEFRHGRKIKDDGSRNYWMVRARKILAEYGYEIERGEHVHHIDHNYKNNSINNLVVLKNAQQHARIHAWDIDKHPNENGWMRLWRKIVYAD
jgi:hypothetical protein